MLAAFTEPNISIREGARLACSAASFLRLWKVWVNIFGFKTETSFISDQTYRDFILAGHNIILSMKIYSIYFPESVYQSWMFGSNECEDLFAGLRGFCRGRLNLCMLDMIELSGRIQKLKELKIKKTGRAKSIYCAWLEQLWNWNNRGNANGRQEVLKTIELLGMLPKLIQGNVIRKEGDNLVYWNGAVELWIDSEDFQPDETKFVEVEELSSLDNEVLFQSLDEQNENNQQNILSDLAATSSIVSDNNNEDKRHFPRGRWRWRRRQSLKTVLCMEKASICIWLTVTVDRKKREDRVWVPQLQWLVPQVLPWSPVKCRREGHFHVCM